MNTKGLAVRNGKNGINKGTMVYILVLINAFLFFASKYGGISTSALYLDHYRPAWYQVFTSTFCHANLQVIWMFYTILEDILSFWHAAPYQQLVSIACLWSTC